MSISLEQTQQRLQSLTEISELLMSAVEPERVVTVKSTVLQGTGQKHQATSKLA